MNRSNPREEHEGTPPPHADELRREATCGSPNRYTDEDDPESRATVEGDVVLNPEAEMAAEKRRRRPNKFDDAQTDDARMEVRRDEPSAD